MSAALIEVRFASSGCSKHAMIRSVAHMAQMHPATDVVITTATIIHVTSYTDMVYWSFFVFNYMLLELEQRFWYVEHSGMSVVQIENSPVFRILALK
jgi:hypothetical protein